MLANKKYREALGFTRPDLPYRKRKRLRDEFEKETDRTLEEIDRLLLSAREDAQTMLAALPNIGRLEQDVGELSRYEFAYLFMRAMHTLREKANPFALLEVVDIVLSDTNSAKALARHAPSRQARQFVRNEWLLHRKAYADNKSAFTRDYVKRVWNELGVEVTEKQMREVWLRDTPPAGKPAGGPADG